MAALLYSTIMLMYLVPVVDSSRKVSSESRKITESCGNEFEQWEYYEKSCFKYIDTKFTFNEARKYCQGFLGGKADVATNLNTISNDYIHKTLLQQEDIWIGLRLDIQNTTYWIDDGQSAYRNWLYEAQDPLKEGYCTTMALNGRWVKTNCNHVLPFVCQKASETIAVNVNLRIIIITVVPSVMLISIMVFVIFLINRSKAEVKLLQQRIDMSDTLHLILTHKNPIKNINKIKKKPSFHEAAKKLQKGYKTPKNSHESSANATPGTTTAKDNKKRGAWENVLNNASLRKKKKKGHPKVPAVLELLNPVEIKPIKTKSKDNVFYIHDEVSSPPNSHIKDSLPIRLSVGRAKSDVVPRRNKIHQKNGKNMRRASTISNPEFAYTQDIRIVLQDEAESLESSTRSSKQSSLGRESTTSSMIGSNRHWYTDSGMLDSLGVEQGSLATSFENSYKVKVNEEDFVEVTLF